MMTTGKIIKKSEAKKIAKANKWNAEETEYFLTSCDWFNKDHDAQANFTNKERNAVAIYLISKEVNERSSGLGQSKDHDIYATVLMTSWGFSSERAKQSQEAKRQDKVAH